MNQPTPFVISRRSQELSRQRSVVLGNVRDAKEVISVTKNKVSMALPKRPNQAEPVNHASVTRRGSYVTGDGDFPVAARPGADDHKKYKSLLLGT